MDQDFIYLGRLLSENDCDTIDAIRRGETLSSNDMIGGEVAGYFGASDVDTSNMVDRTGAFCFYAQSEDEVKEALSICANQHADQDSVMFAQAGINEGVKKFVDSKSGIIIFKMPMDLFDEYSKNGEKIALGEGQYENSMGSFVKLNEALVGKSVFEEVLQDKTNILEYSDRDIKKAIEDSVYDEFDDFNEYDSRDNEYDDYGSYDDYDKDYDNGYGGGYGGYDDGDDFCY